VSTPAERMERRFQVPTLIAALLVIPVIAIEELTAGEPWRTAGMIASRPRRDGGAGGNYLADRDDQAKEAQQSEGTRRLEGRGQESRRRPSRVRRGMEGLRYASVVAVFGIIGGGRSRRVVPGATQRAALSGLADSRREGCAGRAESIDGWRPPECGRAGDGLEPATSTLGRLHSTIELLPRGSDLA
jgi:hypothetical protein